MRKLKKIIMVWIAMLVAKVLSKILDLAEGRDANKEAEWEASLHPTGMRGPNRERY